MEKINVSRIDMQALMQPITPSLRVGVLQYLKYCSICITENISSYFRYQIFSKRKFFNLIIRSLILGNYIPNQSTKSTTISSIMTDVQSNLPRVRPDDLPLFDEASQTMCGFLKKQAGQSSTFSKGKYQKRFFVINDVGSDPNYTLSYFYAPSDKQARQTYQLKRAAVIPAGELKFKIEFEDGVALILAAETKDELNAWMVTLEKVIAVATTRDRILSERRSGRGGYGNDYDDQDGNVEDVHALDMSGINPFQANQRHLPIIRLKYDIHDIPTATTQRRQFIELFIHDLSKVLKLHPKVIEVESVKHAPMKQDMVLIEFDINLYLDPKQQDMLVLRNKEKKGWDGSKGDDDNDDEGIEIDEEYEQELDKERYRILWTLYQMIDDLTSPIYRAGVCQILQFVDKSYIKYLIHDGSDNIHDRQNLNNNMEFISPDERVQEIMNKYKDIDISIGSPNGSNYIDITHFKIFIHFEGITRALQVPNPIALPRKHCAIYPFEIKQCLGLTGTLQELWIEPIQLVPKDMPKALSQPIVFEPSARLNGAVIIHASRLKSDVTYTVECEDYRGEVLRSLSDEEMESIKTTFDTYDANGDGVISKTELEDLIRRRTQERIEVIEGRFEELINDPEMTEEDIVRAEEVKQQHLQHVQESKSRMIKMFDAADINGDGLLSFTEFMLMEAWWLRCTLNPMRAHLF